MKLLVDAGNSRIKFIRQDSHGFSGYGVQAYTKAGLFRTLDHLWRNMPVPEQIWIANVAGSEIADRIERWAAQHWQTKPRFAAVEKQALGVINAYTDVSKLGVDRWLALVAAWNKYASPACIVGCGTAVTVDGLDGTGRHLGGLIVPGIALMQETLHMKTSGIPYIKDFKATTSGLADNTEQAVVSGCTLAVTGLIEHVLRDMESRHDGKMKYLITGGDAEKIMGLLASKFVHEPYLVLEGLALLAGNSP